MSSFGKRKNEKKKKERNRELEVLRVKRDAITYVLKGVPDKVLSPAKVI